MPSPVLPPGLPVPAPTPLDAGYWEAARGHELAVQRCTACRSYQWGPEWVCHRCRSFEVGWEVVARRGRLYSWERVWHPVHPALAEACPYVVVLVELPHAGDVRMVGNLVDDPGGDLPIGADVEAVFEDHDADPPFTLVQWRLVNG